MDCLRGVINYSYLLMGSAIIGQIAIILIPKITNGKIPQYFKEKFGSYNVVSKTTEEDCIEIRLHVQPGKGVNDYIKEIDAMEKLFKAKVQIQGIPYSDMIIIKCYKNLEVPSEEKEEVDVKDQIKKILEGKKC